MNRGFVFLILSALGGGALPAQQAAKLDTTTFIVMGESLAAGMADFALRDVYQKNSFPALMAKQFGTAFPQPLIQPPGIGSVPGYPELPVSVPGPWQTSVRKPFPPTLFVFNLSVPRFRVADAVNLRPTPPLVQQNDEKQTNANLVLGYPALILGTDKPLWTQLEYAVAMNPTLVLVALGYTEALEAAAAGDPNLLPAANAFRSDYARVVSTLRSTYAQVIATTIPDPLDTAYFSDVTAAAARAAVPAPTVVSRYGLRDGDLLTPPALFAIGMKDAALPQGSVLGAARATELRNRLRALNSEITAAARDGGAILYDLNALFARVRSSGLRAGNLNLTADYLGGFYSLSGSYPGMTGHALIANEVLALLNQTFKTSFSQIDLTNVAPTDPAVRMRPVMPR